MRQPINNTSRVPAYPNGRKSTVSAIFCVKSPNIGSEVLFELYHDLEYSEQRILSKEERIKEDVPILAHPL
jgi:hypothetical protein